MTVKLKSRLYVRPVNIFPNFLHYNFIIILKNKHEKINKNYSIAHP